jgi:sugar phosphate isomerase/epimerase
MTKTAIQLYTVRDADESLPELLRRVGDAGYDGVEFAYRVLEEDREGVLEAMDEAGLEAAAAHVGIDALEEDLEGTIETYRELGCDRLVVPYLGDEQFESAEAVAETAERLADLADGVAEHGVNAGYHNHEHEFVDVDGDNAWERLVEETAGSALTFELDVGWAVAGGHDPAALIERHADRIPLVHVTDVDEEGNAAEVGEGVVDLDAVAGAARDAGVEWFVYENDEPEDPLESIEYGADVLAEL